MTTIACKYRRSLGVAVAILIGQLWAAQVQAADYEYDVGPIHIAQPWARATPKGAKSGAGYMTITNNGSTPDRLRCVASDASSECQVHSMTMERGVMKMRSMEGGLEIKPGETVLLKPSSTHLMFLNLKHPLEQSSTIAATLIFEKAGMAKVEFPIAAIGASAPGEAAGGAMTPGGGMMQMKR
jgi:periplasmic copper chaperone A